jgi:hypothetical protein
MRHIAEEMGPPVGENPPDEHKVLAQSAAD